MKKTIALVAHDNKKNDLMEWADFNKGTLSRRIDRSNEQQGTLKSYSFYSFFGITYV